MAAGQRQPAESPDPHNPNVMAHLPSTYARLQGRRSCKWATQEWDTATTATIAATAANAAAATTATTTAAAATTTAAAAGIAIATHMGTSRRPVWGRAAGHAPLATNLQAVAIVIIIAPACPLPRVTWLPPAYISPPCSTVHARCFIFIDNRIRFPLIHFNQSSAPPPARTSNADMHSSELSCRALPQATTRGCVAPSSPSATPALHAVNSIPTSNPLPPPQRLVRPMQKATLPRTDT
ncbi:hypothetical protein CDD81_2051 [Ophiocordyceps australis]|uniref:Uncharacterized protein n=1 Tax=Ophiocordyceps australis TaxID=1399860 RepID=A0A2C5XSC2_9HYPO|nr:hypothetical protein CDD81_2051 [Ophiocordyceps australis]